MLVYSTTLWLNCDFDTIVDVVADWLSYKLDETPDTLALKADEDQKPFVKEKRRLENARWTNRYPKLQSLVFTHPDKRVGGRFWKTQISLRQSEQDQSVETTIVLGASDISTSVSTDIALTRPLVVRHLLDQCSPVLPTAGIRVLELNEHTAEQYLAHVTSRERRSPVVLISPTPANGYLVDAEALLFHTGGIADVVRIAPHADIGRITDKVGVRFAAWNGAVNLVFPPHKSNDRYVISNRVFARDELDLTWAAVDSSHAMLFLEAITHRVNLPNSWRYISIDRVNDHKRRIELQRAKEAAALSGERDEYVKLLEDENQQLSKQKRQSANTIGELQSELNARQAEIDESLLEISKLKKELDGLRLSLGYDRARVNVPVELQALRPALVNAFNENASLTEALHIIELLFKDRVLVLKNAYHAAEESAKFRHRDKAFKLLLDLVTRYWEALVTGRGDIEARSIFGESFAANEGENETNRSAAKRRTFEYKDKQVTMFKHLKIGIKDSVAETLRIHFHWDSDDQKIVIGHCGGHLDHK